MIAITILVYQRVTGHLAYITNHMMSGGEWGEQLGASWSYELGFLTNWGSEATQTKKKY